jgi:hypothetical protein
MRKKISYFSKIVLFIGIFSTKIFAAQDAKIAESSKMTLGSPTLSDVPVFLSDDDIPPPSKPSRHQEPLLHQAIKTGELESVQEALHLSPQGLFKLNKKGNTILHLAASGGHFDIIKYLIDQYKKDDSYDGYYCNYKVFIAKNENKKTALQLADEKNFKCISVCLRLTERFFADKLTEKEKAAIKLDQKDQESVLGKRKTTHAEHQKKGRRTKRTHRNQHKLRGQITTNKINKHRRLKKGQ